jgi:O-antigen/teichoic acid export membrane protein
VPESSINKKHLTSGRLLARNTIWNLIGNSAPMIVGIFSMPILIHNLGGERFGVLALAWTLIGYAGLFDLGLGRALTQLVSKKMGAGQDNEVPVLVWTSLVLMLLLGVVGAVVLVVISPWLVHRALNVPLVLQHETLNSFYLLGLAIPLVIGTAGLRGLLEAHQRFDLINTLRIPMGVFTFASPLIVLPFSKSLFPVVAVLVGGRLIAWGAHLLLCLRVAPAMGERMAWHLPAVGILLRFGGWMTLSNLVGPLMITLDRFVVGALLSMVAVAYYATPFEIATKLWIVSTAISGVMFPAFSLSGALNSDRTSVLYRRAMTSTLAILLPLTTVLLAGAKQGLSLWLGPDFAAHSYRVAQFLLVGAFALGMAALPFALIQGLGRPDIPAKLNLLEIPFYVVGLYWFVSNYGVIGAATAWMLRATADSLLLIFFAHRLQGKASAAFSKTSQMPVPS